jgi:hypothetical protein
MEDAPENSKESSHSEHASRMNEYLTNNGTKSILFAAVSKLAVGSLLPPIHCVPGALFPEYKVAGE